jgi:hypothetical protein
MSQSKISTEHEEIKKQKEEKEGTNECKNR